MEAARNLRLPRASVRLPLLLLLLHRALTQNSVRDTAEDLALLRAHPGCFHHGFKWTPDIPGTQVTVQSLFACQQHCANEVSGCAHFAYWPTTGACFSGGFTSHIVASTEGAIAGRAVCLPQGEEPAACASSELPANGFPGWNATVSNAAWPTGRQPMGLECWPMSWNGGVVPCAKVSVLDDTSQDWPGKCLGLTVQAGVTAAHCPEHCVENPLCASFQVDSTKRCLQGTGRDCLVRRTFHPLAAQRLQHGSVRKLMDLAGWQVVGLARAFVDDDGFFLHDSDATDMCRRVCYSDIRCQYWQYSPKYGCWVEDQSQGFRPLYPLTLDSAYRKTPFALDCIAGEMIQHFCPNDQTTMYPTEAPVLGGCHKQGVRYAPNLWFATRSVEMSADSCQARCGQLPACGHFVFWPDGSCDLQGKEAAPVTAEDNEVISGPASCAVEESVSGMGFDDEAEKLLNPGQPARAGTARAQPPTAPPAHNQEAGASVLQPVIRTPAASSLPPADAKYLAEVRFLIKGLDHKKLAQQTEASLSRMYVSVLASHLHTTVDAISDEPGGASGTVWLRSWVPASTMLTAFLPNQPPNSDNVGVVRQAVLTKAFETSIVQATASGLGGDVSAITDQLEVTSQKVSVVNAENLMSEVSSVFSGAHSGIFFAGLAVICVAIAAFIVLSSRPRKASRPRVSSGSSPRYSKGSASDDDGVGGGGWGGDRREERLA